MKKLLLLLVVGLLLSGCSLFEEEYKMEKSSDELVSEGSSAFMAGDYRTAVRAYTDLKDWYPFSKYAILAELKIADSHYFLEEYVEAIIAYEEFERMHPRNEAVPYVIYKIGMSWFDQIDTVDRDNTPAQSSLIQFMRLIEQYPESEFTGQAKKNIIVCHKNLAGHELYVANFYMKTKKYKAALERFEYLVETYPALKESQEALNKIPECRALIKETKK